MRFRAMSVGPLAVVAIIAGCGGSSKTATSGATTAPSATAATTTSAGATTSAAAPSFASAGNCQQLIGLGKKFAQAFSAATTNGKLDFQTAVSAYQDLASAAPSEIRPDLQLSAQAFASFAAALSKAGYAPGKVPTAAQLASVESAAQVFSQPKFRAAEQRISVWAHQNCG